jgi:hypothetical protein
MHFIALNDALDAIAGRISLPKDFATEPPEIREAYNYAEAAATLHQHFLNAPDLSPRWVEIHPKTGRPVFNDAVEAEGLAMLEHSAGLRPPLGELSSGRYEREKFPRGRDIGFDQDKLVDFLVAQRIDSDLVDEKRAYSDGPVYAGGVTWVDAEYDERLREAQGASDGAPLAHKLKTRRDVLGPIIDLILSSAGEQPDPTAMWNELVRMASATHPVAPLLGFAEGEVKYQGASCIECLSREAFNKRLKRRAEKDAANRR